MRQTFRNLTAYSWLVALFLFLMGVVLTSLPTTWYGAPLPIIHDEFGYILLGETFAHGRLTNPPPPGPLEFFQTYYQFQTPRYYAMYPPGQGFALALGVLLGQPIIGMWIVNGAWAIALYWMLRGLMSRGWALAGALAGMAGYGAFSYWGQSFWGGSVLALGGALTFGGAVRLWRKRGSPLSAAAWAGVGCIIMALTRPLDGCIFALWPTALILWNGRERFQRGEKASGVGVLATFVLFALLGVGLTLGYNVATTGDAFLFAHRLYSSIYQPAFSMFVWQHPHGDTAAVPPFMLGLEKLMPSYLTEDPLTWATRWDSLKTAWHTEQPFMLPKSLWPLAALGVLAGWRARDAWVRRSLLSVAFIALPLAIVRFYDKPHYLAAWTAPLLIIILQGARHLHAWVLRRKLKPRWLGMAAALALLAAFPVLRVYYDFHLSAPYWATQPWASDRHNVEISLMEHAAATGRRQLATVVYPALHNFHHDWIFNSADPASQLVLWARSLGEARDPELFAAFPNYDHWAVFTDADGGLVKAVLLPKPASTAATPTATPAAPQP